MIFLFLLLVASVPACCSELKPMAEIFPTENGTTVVNITVTASKMSIPLKSFGKGVVFEYTGRFYTYNGVASVPGPVIHVKAGKKLKFTLFNDLEAENYKEGIENMYTFHGVNTTNVHFHGVHGDPSVDDVFKTASPGKSLRYSLRIPRDHAPGLHWYHTHSHGSSYLLLMGGLFGPLIIDEGDTLMHARSSFLSLRSVVLVVHLYRLGESKLCDGATMEDVSKLIQSNVSSKYRIKNEDGKVLKMPSDLFLVNGQHQPVVTVSQGVSTLLRMMFAAGSCHLNVTLPKACRFDVSAADGVPLKVTREVKDRWLYFTTATRYDVIILCEKEQESMLPVFLAEDKEVVLFYIDVEQTRSEKRHSVELPLIPWTGHADYLFMDNPKILRDISFSQRDIPSPRPYYVIGQGTNCSSLSNSTTCYYEHFSGRKGSDRDRYNGFAVPKGSVVEAHIFGDPLDTVPHPFHMHVNHFKFVSFTPRKGGKHENLTMSDFGVFPGDIRDTIPILDGMTVIHWQTATYTGEVVYHCHALAHEDKGMMTSYLVYQEYGGISAVDPNPNNVSQNDPVITDGHVFLILACIFLIGALLSVAVAWFKANPPHLGTLASTREGLVNTILNRTDEGEEMERIPLSGCNK